MSKNAKTTTELQPTFTVKQGALANGEEARIFKNLQPILAEIRQHNKLIGFTVKNSTHASAVMDEPIDLHQLSLLADQIFRFSAKLLNACDQTSMKSAVLEGSEMRILCLNICGNQVSFFMDKIVDSNRILEKLAEAEN
jgi:hypothetical protein